ncbi:hypothetical protein [Flavobacterium sp. XGLA_31]|uniref:hypothetical protein n=1 Tax=Flavobacterium sp. XGLA_31 TaxID=3447666 RepID=UPI003F3665E9
MKKFLLKIALYTLALLLFFNAVAWCSLYFLRNSSFYKPEFLTHEVKENQFDYIIIGSSIGLTSLNTVQIDSTLKTTGLNLSIDDTSINSNYLMLEHFYHQNKKAAYCILAVNYWDLANEKPTLSDNDYRFLPFVNEAYVFDYYSELETGYFKPLTWSHYMPFVGVGYYNTEVFYSSVLAAVHPEKRNRFDAKGNYSYPNNGEVKSKNKTMTTLEWKNPFIKRIQQLCDKNHTQLIIYQAPNFSVSIKNNQANFVLINHSDLITKPNLFYDELHLNEGGRKLATQAFANDFDRLRIKK